MHTKPVGIPDRLIIAPQNNSQIFFLGFHRQSCAIILQELIGGTIFHFVPLSDVLLLLKVNSVWDSISLSEPSETGMDVCTDIFISLKLSST